MKKLLTFLVLATIGGFVFAQEAVTLDAAIHEAAAFIQKRLLKNSTFVVSNIESDHVRLSEYIIDKLTTELTIDGQLRLAARDGKTLQIVADEQKFQLNGSVPDDKVMSLTNALGADYLISGSMRRSGNIYHLSLQVVEPETKEVKAKPPTMEIKKSDRQIVRLVPVDNSWKEKQFYFGARAGGVLNIFGLSETNVFYQDGKAAPSISFNGAGQFAWHTNEWIAIQAEFLFFFSEMNWAWEGDTQTITTSNIVLPLLFKPTFWGPGDSMLISPVIGPYLKLAWGSYRWQQTYEAGYSRLGEGNVFFEAIGGVTVGVDVGLKVGPGILFLDARYLFDGGRSRIAAGTTGDLLYHQNAASKGTMYRMHNVMLSMGYQIGFGERRK